MTSLSTQITLSSEGTLQLVLPDGRGGERLLALPEGEAEGTLRRILRAQQRNPRIGVEGPATYIFSLHLARHRALPSPNCTHCLAERFLAEGGAVTVVAPGASAPIIADTNPEELGL